ncbi:YitT family protein [Alkalibacter rhizosphaerae]|uniref:YitT family protein n=1 Tax=Alkalibacter rhizosphaerae TaxID=2815577 RepID=A0A974XDM9_9FIRM|nr:YitT family protein [Alkalibacter rhizosphaerae]QSX07731.1 YitT family protein [Alkalibacter rhizosphaerae]
MRERIKPLSGEIKSYVGITIGTMIMAFGFNSFSIPNKIAPGGFSGLATVLYHLSGYPVGLVTLIITIPLFFVAFKLLGGRFGVKTFYGTVLFSLNVDLIMRTPTITNDIFLASVFGGVILGAGVGVVFKFGGTTGGTDLLASIMHKYFRGVSIGTWLMIIDSMVVVFAGLVFRNMEITLYSTLTLYLSMKVIDLIQEGISYAKAFYIISPKAQQIADAILTDMDRGVTLLNGKGAYTGDDRSVVFCVVHRSQIFQMKDIVRDVDPGAFVILGDVYEVLGEGFKRFEAS